MTTSASDRRLPPAAYEALLSMQRESLASALVVEKLMVAAIRCRPLQVATPSDASHCAEYGPTEMGRSVFAERTLAAAQESHRSYSGWMDSISEALAANPGVSIDKVDEQWLDEVFAPRNGPTHD